MDPVRLLNEEQTGVRAALDADDPGVIDRLARYLDIEERVLFDATERHLDVDDEVALAREAHARLRSLVDGDAPPGGELVAAFADHIEQVNTRLLAPLITRLDATEFDDLGDALEEARQSWDEHEQVPQVRVGVDDPSGPDLSGSPGAHLADEALPATPEPNEPA